jgi:hypothetical protein
MHAYENAIGDPMNIYREFIKMRRMASMKHTGKARSLWTVQAQW